ncbi:MAG: M16 family metallopeptidase [Flavobacteriaceae bacterium]
MISLLSIFTLVVYGQEVKFEEYDLPNELHVILHQDNNAPVVTTSVLYHVGGKDEKESRTGFSHFFEHLLFEGTKHIRRGEWPSIVADAGGTYNAYTSDDYTYYYEIFPSNQLQLSLWMESERMLHPLINQAGVNTQNEVVKEEKRANYDNRPYGYYEDEVKKNIFDLHPYKRASIGSMEDLDAASLEEFIDFRNQYYIPNNAVLVVAGDINISQTKQWIEDYFSSIPMGPPIKRISINETPIEKARKATYYDKNIQIPALITAYRIPGVTYRDSKVLEIISTYLSDGKSSRLYKRMVDKEKIALEVAAFNLNLEDYGIYIILGLPLGENTFDDLLVTINEEISKIQETLISERDYQKIQNKFETDFINANGSVEGIANSLAEYYTFYGDTNLINKEIDLYRSITREDIRRVANKYLNPQQRLILNYLPASVKQ